MTIEFTKQDGRALSSEDVMAVRLEASIRKGQAILQTQKSPPRNYVGYPDTVDFGMFSGWRAQARTVLLAIFQEGHSYITSFDNDVKHCVPSDVKAGNAILSNVIQDLRAGYLKSYKSLIAAELFTDFLDMAAHLLESDYKDAAAMLTGAVLERGLRDIAASHNITVKEQDELSSLNQRCASAGAYNPLKQKQVQAWIDIRNSAAHGKFEEYKLHDVQAMHTGVSQFLADYLR